MQSIQPGPDPSLPFASLSFYFVSFSTTKIKANGASCKSKQQPEQQEEMSNRYKPSFQKLGPFSFVVSPWCDYVEVNGNDRSDK